MDLFEDPIPGPDTPGRNAPEFTVSELSGAVKRVIEGEFGRVRVRGEVGRVMIARTGHMYFDLKDDRSVIASVSWKGQVAKMPIRPEEGMEVIATGRMTTFGPQSKYQLQVESITPAGAGALMAMLEKRKAALGAEGLFDAGRKRPLPYLPRVIGVVTSPTGAVIRDILHRVRERFPVHVIVWPVAVQGDGCAPQVTLAINGFNAIAPGGPVPRPDVIIVARGGGSIEDLWGFNEESVVRAAAASTIPLISAVGHETDTTLIDFASDLRAPTPTAAAELAVPVRADLLAQVAALDARLIRAGGQTISQRRQRLRDLARALPRPDTLMAPARQRFDQWADRLPGSLRGLVVHKRLTLNTLSAGVRPSALTQRLGGARDRLGVASERLMPGLARTLVRQRERLEAMAPRLRADGLTRARRDHTRALTEQGLRLNAALRNQMQDHHRRLDGLERLRQTLGYEATLARGYAVVRDASGAVITTAQATRQHRALEVAFADARVDVVLASAGGPTDPGHDGPLPEVPKPAARARKAPQRQLDDNTTAPRQPNLFDPD
ncbi:exodeoxyribonuclease VII large subunit [Roseicitreum antarcticum]|uniref:Exodeoxyribonuclease 7 large subunit n=1 Tax=Roseicitreum antarcticum TaxID=564137 RepID=A0A1H2XXA9_9RHOB|nr:exodeoxyribonuclease VII large subunit [Roseicitreum antarcticum]SDW97563.1 Exodeoxyribonuclease VII large subunit [Roseicitreum antarcticum]